MPEQQPQVLSTEQQVTVLYQMTRSAALSAEQHELAKQIAENLIGWMRGVERAEQPETEEVE